MKLLRAQQGTLFIVRKTMDLKELEQEAMEFRDALDWEQYPNPKDLAISMSLGSCGREFSSHV
jgi:hypothetical protein